MRRASVMPGRGIVFLETGVFSVEEYFLKQMIFSVEMHKQGESQR